MQINTRSRAIREALARVRKRIPVQDWHAISSFLTRISGEREWRAVGAWGYVDTLWAGLFPVLGRCFEAVPGGQIIFFLPLLRLYSRKAIVGVVAHELGHALRASKMGPEWHEHMQRRWQRVEHEANALASRWGFRSHIRAMRNERRRTLNPYLSSPEKKFLGRIHRRDQEQVCHHRQVRLLQHAAERQTRAKGEPTNLHSCQ